MALWTDIIDPADLVGYVRADVTNYEANTNLLSQVLPNQEVADIVVRFTAGSLALSDAAQFRSYDAETPIGRLPSRTRNVLELPPLGDKVRVGEYDRLRGMGQDSNDNVLVSVQKVALAEGRKVADRIELARGQALVTGKLTINENGFNTVADFGRSGTHDVTASSYWSTSSVNVLNDLATWQQVYTDDTGVAPGVMLMSTQVMMAIQASDVIRAAAGYRTSDTSVIASRQMVADVMTAYGLPRPVIYDKTVRVAGVNTRVIASNRVVFAPPLTTAPEGTELGGTWWGRTLESMEPDYALAPQFQPGIVVGTYKEYDPLGVWVHSTAIGAPILANPDLTFVARVLA